MRKNKQLIKSVLTLGLFLLLLSGCTLQSSGSTFQKPKEEEELTSFDARELLKTAIETTKSDPHAQKFWYNGYIKNSIEKRTTTSMYEGVVNKPKEAYIVNGRIAAQPFQYYSWGDQKFIRKGQTWFKADKNEQDILPLEPFTGFDAWLPLMQNAVKLKDEAILSNPCDVIQVKISGTDWVKYADTSLFAQLKSQLGTDEAVRSTLDNTVVKTTLWLGQTDHRIYQYSTWIVMPLPGAGYFDQETFFRFYSYNDPGIDKQLQTPEKVQEWVDEFEEKQKSGEIE